jgi:O-antigen/teichoic acid export membrane protein
MPSVRRAFVWATFARYSNIAINLATTIIVARTVSPAAYGVSVLCASVFSIAEAFREFGGGAYLIQQRQLTAEKIRTSITVNAIITCTAAAVVFAASGQIANFLHVPEMKRFLHVSVFAYLCGPFIYPTLALLSREMKFNRTALITIAMTIVTSVVTIGLALQGFEYMSFAWANVAAAVIGACFCLRLSPHGNVYRPSLANWRDATAFGAFDCLTSLAAAFAEYAPYLAVSRFLPTAEVAIAQRAVSLALIPERVLLAGIGAVALPEFSRRAHDKSDLRRVYFATLELSTAVYWPTLVVLGLLADPIVTLLYGPKWRETAEILPLICVAFSFAFPATLQYPALVAAGAVRVLPGLVALQGALTFAAVASTARFGLVAVAASLVVSLPVNVLIGGLAIKRTIGMQWLSLASSLRKSVLVTLFASCGPLAVMALTGSWRLSIPEAAIAAVLTAAFWAAGILLTRHPLAKELRRVLSRYVAPAS